MHHGNRWFTAMYLDTSGPSRPHLLLEADSSLQLGANRDLECLIHPRSLFPAFISARYMTHWFGSATVFFASTW
jgi:hypothetical protein